MRQSDQSEKKTRPNAKRQTWTLLASLLTLSSSGCVGCVTLGPCQQNCGELGDAAPAPDLRTPPDLTMGPSLFAAAPATALTSGGVTLTLRGSGFAPGASVRIGGQLSDSVTVVSANEIQARVPAQPGAFGKVPLVITNTDNQSTTRADLFSYLVTTIAFSRKDYPAGTGPHYGAFGDLNGDGKLDLVVSNLDSGDLSIGINQGGGALAFGVPLKLPAGDGFGVALANVDRDPNNQLDILVAHSRADKVGVQAGNGDGTFKALADVSAGAGPAALAVADLQGRKVLDLVVMNNRDATVSVCPGRGDGSFACNALLRPTRAGNGQRLVLGDLNGDGYLDVVTVADRADNGHYQLNVFPGKANGAFDSAREVPTCDGYGLVLADLSGEGFLDLAVSCQDKVYVHKGRGDLSFFDPVAYPVAIEGAALQAADLNGDGVLDLIGYRRSGGGVCYALGNGDGSFAAGQCPAALTAGAGTTLIVGLLDGDQKPDVVVMNRNDNTLSVLLNTSL